MGKSSPTKWQRKDIPAKALIDLVDRLYNIPRFWGVAAGFPQLRYSTGASLREICEFWSDIPPKVLQAKLKQLIDQNFLDGCACGCSSRITVIHETDLPIMELVDELNGTLVRRQVRIPRSMYHSVRYK
jgi:hypothetical protein